MTDAPGPRWNKVAHSRFRADPGHDDYTLLGATKDSLKSLPEFDYAK